MIIGLGHKARVGKDTVAEILCREHGFKRMAFADKLKEGARAIFGLSREQTDGIYKAEQDCYWGMTPREILQRMGTDAFRSVFGPDFWILALRRELDPCLCARVVITDVRFPNEAAAIRAWGGHLVRVDRPAAYVDVAAAQHASETALDSWQDWDRVLDNSASLAALPARVNVLVRELTARELHAREIGVRCA